MIIKWNIPKEFLDSLFRGNIKTIEIEKESKITEFTFQRWVSDLITNSSILNEICALEIQAYLKRMAFQFLETDQVNELAQVPLINFVEKMAIFIAEKFTQSIKVTDIAESVGLNPDYANAVF